MLLLSGIVQKPRLVLRWLWRPPEPTAVAAYNTPTTTLQEVWSCN